MITSKKAVLVTTEIANNNSNFEAIVPIQSLSEVEGIWRYNKTPIILKENIGQTHNYNMLYLSPYIVTIQDFIDFCHGNDIECGEYLENNKYNTFSEKCFLCNSGHHEGYPDYVSFNANVSIDNIVIYQSEHFTVKIELGCMTKGMLMINHKEHILSAAQIPVDQMDEYHQVMQDIEFLLKAVYGEQQPVIFFEHGSHPSGISSHRRSIVHHHTHVAVGLKFEQKYLDMVCLKPISDICQLNSFKYFSYQEGANGQLYAVWDPEVYVQRQYPRQIIGLMLGIENAKTNWRNEPFEHNISETFRDIYKFLIANKPFLSSRLVKATDCFLKGYPLRADF